MKNNQKGISILTGTLALAGAGVVLAGGLVYNAGAVRISVHEKRPGGDNIRLVLPAAVVPAVMAVLPDRVFQDLPREARENLPVLRIAARELRNLPDGPLVEVRSPGEEVVIAVEDGTLTIDVNDRSDEVHLRIPLGAVESVASRLADIEED